MLARRIGGQYGTSVECGDWGDEDGVSGTYGWGVSGDTLSDGRTLVTGSRDNTARVWNVETGEMKRVLEGHTSTVSVVVLSNDGKTLVTGSWDNTARVWNVETGKTRRAFKEDTAYVLWAALSIDGKFGVTRSAKESFFWSTTGWTPVSPHEMPAVVKWLGSYCAFLDSSHVLWGKDSIGVDKNSVVGITLDASSAGCDRVGDSVVFYRGK